MMTPEELKRARNPTPHFGLRTRRAWFMTRWHAASRSLARGARTFHTLSYDTTFGGGATVTITLADRSEVR